MLCPGPAALYRPTTNELNSCPPGTPWKAMPVSVPSARKTRTQGRSGPSDGGVHSTVSLSVKAASSMSIRRRSSETGRLSGSAFRMSGRSMRAKTPASCSRCSAVRNPPSVSRAFPEGAEAFEAPEDAGAVAGRCGRNPVLRCMSAA